MSDVTNNECAICHATLHSGTTRAIAGFAFCWDCYDTHIIGRVVDFINKIVGNHSKS